MNKLRTSVLPVLVVSIFFAARRECRARTFAEDVALLKQHTEVIVLDDAPGQAKLAIAPGYQGRVMTSTNAGDDAPGFGWVNEEAIRQGPVAPHMNLFGGEDRFWLAPEGGQYAIFFKQGDPFDFEHWQTPPLIDTVPYEAIEKTQRSVVFRHNDTVTNYSGTKFDVQIDRRISLLEREVAESDLGAEIPAEVKVVVYVSQNKVTNTGDKAWKKQTGLLSIWILGMLKGSPTATVVVPFERGDQAGLGPIVNDEYFGKVPSERLVVDERRGVLFFQADGLFRSKIGLTPRRAKRVLGSYDPAGPRMTIVQYSKPEGATDYPNSMWELQENPYGGDVINSYNDGGQEGTATFYELETTSPAKALAPGASLEHTHQTLHLTGPKQALDAIAKQVFGVGVEGISGALAK